MDKGNVIQKIRKLLQLQYGAEKIGSTGEAYQAAKMVRKLLLEYNLSMSDINAADQQEQSRIIESDPLSYADQYGVTWKQNLMMIICRYNLCSVIVCPRNKQMNIVGTYANVIIVKEFYEYLLQVFRRLSVERLNEAQNEYLGTVRFMTEPMKKDYLRSRGVTVVEYAGDYGKAVEQGRAVSISDASELKIPMTKAGNRRIRIHTVPA